MEVDCHMSLKLARQLVHLIVGVFHSIVQLLIGPLLLVLHVERHISDLAGKDQQVAIDVGELDTLQGDLLCHLFSHFLAE